MWDLSEAGRGSRTSGRSARRRDFSTIDWLERIEGISCRTSSTDRIILPSFQFIDSRAELLYGRAQLRELKRHPIAERPERFFETGNAGIEHRNFLVEPSDVAP